MNTFRWDRQQPFISTHCCTLEGVSCWRSIPSQTPWHLLNVVSSSPAFHTAARSPSMSPLANKARRWRLSLFKRQSPKHHSSHGFSNTCALVHWDYSLTKPFLSPDQPPPSKVLRALPRYITRAFAMCRNARFCHFSKVSTSRGCHAWASGAYSKMLPNQCLPHHDFGAQADGARNPRASRLPSLALGGLQYSHMCLCMRPKLLRMM